MLNDLIVSVIELILGMIGIVVISIALYKEENEIMNKITLCALIIVMLYTFVCIISCLYKVWELYC